MSRSNSWKRVFYSMWISGVIVFAIATYSAQLMAAAPTKVPPAASGELAVYTAWDEGDINALIAGFNKVYPNVKVSAIRSEGGRGALLERMLTEIDSGKAMADVYNTGIPDMTAMLQRKEILSYRSPSESNVERRFVFEDGLLHTATHYSI
jgi:iron(III) transport system substrate-binding protein